MVDSHAIMANNGGQVVDPFEPKESPIARPIRFDRRVLAKLPKWRCGGTCLPVECRGTREREAELVRLIAVTFGGVRVVRTDPGRCPRCGLIRDPGVRLTHPPG